MILKRLLFFYILFSSTILLANNESESVWQQFDNEENPRKAAEILSQFAERTVNDRDRYTAFVKLAQLYQLTGQYEKASRYYEKAFSALPSEPDFSMLLNSAALLIEINQWDEAENRLDICLIRCKNEDHLTRAHFYIAYLAFLKGDSRDCADHIRKILDLNTSDSNHDAFADFLPWISFFSQYNPDSFRDITDYLKKAGYTIHEDDFDTRLLSPILMLSETSPFYRASERKSDSAVQDQSSPEKKNQKLIVAGSYLKEENADAVLQDLEMQGFSGRIQKIRKNGNDYYRIYILPIENDYKNTLSFLKKLDIDAFIVNETEETY